MLEAVFKMASQNIGALCIGDRTERGVRLHGVLSERDLITKIGSSVTKVSGHRVSDIMTPSAEVACTNSEDHLMTCLKTMLVWHSPQCTFAACLSENTSCQLKIPRPPTNSLLQAGNFRHLPVEEDGDIVSMISIKDIAWSAGMNRGVLGGHSEE